MSQIQLCSAAVVRTGSDWFNWAFEYSEWNLLCLPI